MEVKPTPLFTFASVAEAVDYMVAHGYRTLIEETACGDRIMIGACGDYAIVRHVGLLNAEVYEDQGYWEDKCADYISDMC